MTEAHAHLVCCALASDAEEAANILELERLASINLLLGEVWCPRLQQFET